MQTGTQEPKSIAEYLESLAWDGTPRIERWLIDYAGARDTPYVHSVARLVLSAVAQEAPIKVTVRSGVEILRGRAGVGEYEPDEPDAAVEFHVVSVVVGADAFESRYASFDEASGAAMRAASLLGLRGFTYEVL